MEVLDFGLDPGVTRGLDLDLEGVAPLELDLDLVFFSRGGSSLKRGSCLIVS